MSKAAQESQELETPQDRVHRTIGETPFATRGTAADEWVPVLIKNGRDVNGATKLAMTDIALLFDLATKQAELLAGQAVALEELKAEVRSLRQERIVSDAMLKVQEAFLAAVRDGVSVKKSSVTFDVKSSFEAAMQQGTGGAVVAANAHQGNAGVAAKLGELSQLISGASLSARKSTETISQLSATIQTAFAHSQTAAQHSHALFETEGLEPPRVRADAPGG